MKRDEAREVLLHAFAASGEVPLEMLVALNKLMATKPKPKRKLIPFL